MSIEEITNFVQMLDLFDGVFVFEREATFVLYKGKNTICPPEILLAFYSFEELKDGLETLRSKINSDLVYFALKKFDRIGDLFCITVCVVGSDIPLKTFPPIEVET